MWIVVVIETYYPSVLHFENEDLAKEAYEKHKNKKAVVHMAEVKSTTFNEELAETDMKEKYLKTWNVEWYL